MKTLTTYSKPQLEEMKLADITDINNGFATELGLKTTKRFASKDKAVSRTMQNQELYEEEFKAKHQAKATKAVAKVNKAVKAEQGDKIHGLNRNATLTVVKGQPKEGSIEHSLVIAIEAPMLGNTVEEVVDYIVKHHKRPRSGTGVDTQYAAHNIKWFVNKGHLKLEEV